MAGTFASFGTALSALRYNRVVLDIANSNIANVSTEGYVRRRAQAESVGAPSQPALWSRYDGHGEGVALSGIQRMTDPLLDARVRREHGNQSYLDVRQTVLERVETGIGEPGDDGVAAALAEFRQGWHDVVINPGGDAARQQVLARAASVADALRIQSRNISTEEGDQRIHALSIVSEVNTVSADLAALNKTIGVAAVNGSDAGTLLDSRDQLALRLAEMVGGRATVGPDGMMGVTVNGVSLVSGAESGTLVVTGGVTADGGADGAPVAFAVDRGGVATAVPSGMLGELGAVTDLLNTTLPGYRAGLVEIARTLADEINAQHQAGYDKAGAAGEPLFAYDAADPASTLAVRITDPGKVAASAVPGGGTDAGNADRLADATSVEGSYQRLVNSFGTEVASVRRLAGNQQALTAQVDGAREQLAGVNLDEEMVEMVTAQRAYEAAGRLMTTLDSVLDTLINRTGLVR